MLGSALIVFREVLEAAIIIGIACAATRGVDGRNRWVAGGIGLGVAGACVVAAFAEVIAQAAEGMGQELFNAGVLLAAVGMLGWHNVWMARHGREMAQEMSTLGRSVHEGSRPMYALGLVIALAVLREGSEVVLFLYGLAAGGAGSGGMLAGSALGIVAGTTLGVVMYLGLLRIPMRHFFSVTSWMILLLAAGMASQAAGFLIQADYLPSLGARIWDSSGFISHDSLAGRVLSTLIGYDPRPAGMQLLFYLVTLSTIGVAMKLFGRPAGAPSAVATAFVAALIAGGALAPERAEAGVANKVYRPAVDLGETEIELRGGYADLPDGSEVQAHIIDIGYGVTSWWFTEAVFETETETDPAGVEEHAQGVEWENVFRLTEAGQYFVDLGWYLETAAPLGEPDGGFAVETGPILEKQIGRFVTTANLLGERTFGFAGGNENEASYRLQTHYLSGTPVEFGLQAFGAKVEHGEEEHIVGPALFGMARLGDGNKLKWDAAYLTGLTDDSEDSRIRWELEFEFY